ncbi:MAG TPA: 4Fe-4S dicluster domain-containing protein [Fimbriiglobus sp.]|nr:4Fe-4S dicluster domain-containing protein [Fimbriiglobus sp.]
MTDDLSRRYVELGLYQGQELLVLDLEKCTRCDECVRACADSHGGVTRVVRDGPRFGHFLVAVSCRSCHDPYCLTGCPVDAIHREGFTLEVRIDDHCIGCGLCAHNCPYGSIHMVERGEDGREWEVPPSEWPRPEEVPGAPPDGEPPTRRARLKAVNCDLCAGSRTGPRCVYACPHDAAHRLTGDRVMELAAARAAPPPPSGFWVALGRLCRGNAKGE